MDFWISGWISGFHLGFLISSWISGFLFRFLISDRISIFQFGFQPTVYEISLVAGPSVELLIHGVPAPKLALSVSKVGAIPTPV